MFKRSSISNGLSGRRFFFTEKEDIPAKHAENGLRKKIRSLSGIRWNQAVNVRSIHAKTFKDLAFQFGASVSTVIRRFDAVAKRNCKVIPNCRKSWPGEKMGNSMVTGLIAMGQR
ncbi:MAG: hypothetical protein BAA03_02020 [Caldibacillus debilis]|nr:MAG: hypothetical protein BAA03_02020 [Caldibacillus debilis]